jgi:hypothetical protein
LNRSLSLVLIQWCQYLLQYKSLFLISVSRCKAYDIYKKGQILMKDHLFYNTTVTTHESFWSILKKRGSTAIKFPDVTLVVIIKVQYTYMHNDYIYNVLLFFNNMVMSSIGSFKYYYHCQVMVHIVTCRGYQQGPILLHPFCHSFVTTHDINAPFEM